MLRYPGGFTARTGQSEPRTGDAKHKSHCLPGVGDGEITFDWEAPKVVSLGNGTLDLILKGRVGLRQGELQASDCIGGRALLGQHRMQWCIRNIQGMQWGVGTLGTEKGLGMGYTIEERICNKNQRRDIK